MARPLFPVTAAARLDIGLTSPSRHIYFDLVAQYSFGTPVIHGRSPSELAATKGLTFFNAPGDPGINASVPGVVVVSFPYPTPQVVIGGVPHPVDVLVGGGTIVGANYTDGNGQFFPDVDWEWAISVEGYQASGGGTPSPGRFDGEIVFWTGDGTASKLIPTSFALNAGVVGIVGYGGINASSNNQCAFFRHNQAAMTGTAVCGTSTNPLADGILTFEAGGFRVSAGVFVENFANTLNVKYCAIVLKDTSGLYLRCGNYLGVLGGQVQAFVTRGSSIITRFGGIPWTAGLSLTIQDTSGNFYAFLASDATNATINPPFIPVTGGIEFFTIVGAAPGTQRVIPTFPAIAPYALRPITHCWVWGDTLSYKSIEVPGQFSASMVSGGSGSNPDITHLTALGNGSFTVTDNLNGLNHIYSYIALSSDATFLATKIFKSFSGASTGAAQVIGGIGFTPAIACARQGTAAFTAGGIWRAFTQIGTGSNLWSRPGGVTTDNNGIRAIGVDDVTFDVEATGVTPGDPFYGWVWNGGSVVVPGQSVFVLVPPPIAPSGTPPGGRIPGGTVPGGGGQACRIGSAGLNAV